MRQIAMGAMELDHLESCGECASRGVGESVDDVTNSAVIQRSWDGIALAEGDGAGRDGFPSAGVDRDRSSVVFPRNIAACFSARVGDLNTGYSAVLLDEGRYAREHRDVVVLPDSVIAGGDASARLDGGGFHHYESGAAYCAAAQVYQMPVRRESVDAGILAHGRHGDPIAKRDFADGQGSEQMRFIQLSV